MKLRFAMSMALGIGLVIVLLLLLSISFEQFTLETNANAWITSKSRKLASLATPSRGVGTAPGTGLRADILSYVIKNEQLAVGGCRQLLFADPSEV